MPGLDPFAGAPAASQSLVGRGDELALISTALDALVDGSAGAIVQVAGEPGIGKTAVLHALISDARGRDFLVLAGRAAEFQAELPFGMFLDAIDDWLTSVGKDRLTQLAGGLAGELSTVFPAFDPIAPARTARLPEERYRAYRAVRALLAAIAVETPVVLALDDIHWADPASIELLCHLLARPAQAPLLLALAFRPAQVPRLLATAMAAAAHERRAIRVDLPLLNAATAVQLLEGAVAPSLTDHLYRESGGNPFFLLQLARGAGLAERDAAPHPDGSAVIPEAVRAALASELSAMSADGLILLQGAAVAGDPFDLHAAAAAADLSAAKAFDVLDELLAFALVHATPVGARFAFRHPIVRATVYQSAGRGWLARAHGRLAEFLGAQGAGPSARAPHVERSAGSGDTAAIALLAAAAAESAPRAPALAARWYRAALELLATDASAQPRRIPLLIAMAGALAGSGQLEASCAALSEVLDELPAEHPARAQVIAACAGVEHLLGRHRRAHARVEQAYQMLPANPAEAVALKLELAAGGGFECRMDDMRQWARQARDGAARIGRPALEVVAAGQVALAGFFLGRPSAMAEMDAAGELFERMTDAQLAERLDLGIWIGWTEAVLERHDHAVDHCRRVIDVCRATGQGGYLPLTMTAMAWALIRQGRLTEAEETLTATIEAGRLTPNLFFAVAVGQSAVVATQRGDLAAAVRAGEECVALSSGSDAGLIPGMCGVYLAIPLIELGEAERARDAVLARAGGPELPMMSRSGHTTAYEILTRAALVLGDCDAAEAWAERAQAATHARQLPIEAVFADRASAAVSLRRGDAGYAAEIALGAAVSAAAAGAPVESARCRMLGARALLRDGDRARAVAELEGAAMVLGQTGAFGYQAETERELRRLGRRVRRRPDAATRDGLSTLTAREYEIADLVRQGRTNREIASIAILSERTVERHLTHIFTKLGVSNRSALASRVAEADASV